VNHSALLAITIVLLLFLLFEVLLRLLYMDLIPFFKDAW
jgi:hypothetical protein